MTLALSALGCDSEALRNAVDLAEIDNRTQKLNTVTNAFETLTPSPVVRNGTFAAVDGTSLHLFAGVDKDLVIVDAVETLDTTNGQYRSRKAWPNPRLPHRITKVGSQFCIGHGSVDLDVVDLVKIIDCYDPAKDEWSQLPDLPVNVNLRSLGVHGGNIYAMGGHRVDGTSNNSNRAFMFDPAMMQWKELPAMPFECRNDHVITVGDIIYVLGCTAKDVQTDFSAFDTKTQMWITPAAPPSTFDNVHSYESPFLYGNGFVYFMAIGGQQRVWHYDAMADAWTQSDLMPVNATRHAVAMVGDKVYVRVLAEGQASTTNSVASGKIYTYDMVAKTWTLVTEIEAETDLEIRAVSMGTDIYFIGAKAKLGLSTN